MSIKTVEKLETKTRAFIAQAIKDIISDPDFGLELTKKAQHRLKQARAFKGKTISLQEIKKKYY